MKRSPSCHSLFFLAFLFLTPHLTYGQADIFEVRTPNVMIIFDTSSSMEMQPNGSSQSAGNMCIKNDGSGDSATPDPKVGCQPGYTNLKFDSGGNHPNSKLYQAKKALNDIITSVVKDRVNLGFSTYAQFKTEKRRGKYSYTRKAYTSKRYWAYYKRKDTYTAYSLQSDSFTDNWNILQTNMGKDKTFSRAATVYKSSLTFPPHPTSAQQQVISLTYIVTNVVYQAEYNWYKFSYENRDPYDWYAENTFTIDACSGCDPDCKTDTVNDPFPATWTSGTDFYSNSVIWKTYFKGDAEYKNPTGIRAAGFWNCSTTAAAYTTNWQDTTLDKTHPSCDATKTSGGYTYTLVGPCFDFSDYYYPADGSTNKPHTWSYFKVSSSRWPDNSQTPNYYPSVDSGGNVNNNPGTFNNYYFFTNFPDDKKSDFHTTDRTVIMNQIKSYLDLTPVLNPQSNAYWTKLPVHSTYGKMGLTSNTLSSVYTPLADSLADANRYFNDYINNYNGGDPSSKQKFGGTACRGNYIVLLTDGLESCRCTSGPCPSNGTGTPYDAAPALEAANLLSINVKTFVIGFGSDIDIKGNETLNNIAASGGTGKAYFATNLDELKKALGSIFQTITGQNYGRSNPVVSSTRDRIYRGYFELPGYKGHLVAFDLNSDGSIGDQAWDAGDIMNTNGRGNVYTWADDEFEPKTVDFKVGNSDRLKDDGNYLLNPPPEQDINLDGKPDKNDSEAVINFILDASYGQKDAGGLWAFPYQGQRSVIANPPYPPDLPVCWKLGDIYHSTPLIVGAPPLNIPDDQFPTNPYSAFKTTWKDRETIIYVGANDGMLHAFDNNGNEKFSIIPRDLLGKLRDIRNVHDFYVDSSPKAYDVYFTKRKYKNQWNTILMSGERSGGNYYFAINITDPDNPGILWEMTDSGMGNTWSRPEIGRVKVDGQEKFVAFVGGGYSTTDNVGNTFYIIDVEDGTIIKSFVVGDKSNKVPAGATALDKDLDGRIDAVYFGDIQGALWKIKIVGDKVADWKLIKLFTSDGGNPIFYPPAVTKNNQEKILVYFGQGDELNLFENVKDYYLYEIWDSETDVDNSGAKNWAIKLPNKGEKVLASPSVGNKVIYFTTWQYTGENNCGAGAGRVYGLTSTTVGVLGGLAALAYDVSGKSLANPVQSIDIGIGIPSAPIVIPGRIYISTSLNANTIISIPIPSWGKGRLKYWREVF